VSDKAQLNVVMKNLERLRGEYNDLQSETKTKKEKIKGLQDEIMKIGGIKLQMQNSKVESVCQKLDILVAKLKKVKSASKKSGGDVVKFQKLLQNSERDVELSSNELKVIEEQLKHTKLALAENDTNMTETLNLKVELKEQSEQLKEQMEDMEESINEFKSIEIEMKNKLEKLNSLLTYIKSEITQQEKGLNELSIRDVTHTLGMLDDNKMDSVKEDVKNNQELDQEYRSCETQDESEIKDDETSCDNYHPMNVDETSDEVSRGIPRLSEDELRELDVELIESKINELSYYVEETNVDIGVLEEYARRLAEFKRRKLDLNNAVQKRDEVKEQLGILKKKRFDEFMAGFNIISMTLKEMYQMITMGGNAELELVDSLDPFSEGVTFSVMPPKKSWRNITNLSGGEKTLSSLALVFALHKYKPTPLYVMDEIDAALDFRNVSIVANYIKERTKNAQFIVISLRNNMFELAQQLVGVYKRDNRTKSTTIKNIDILNRT
ncbi:YLR086Wp-like protein, partial [Saccharomyces cerevisiae AWRI1631]